MKFKRDKPRTIKLVTDIPITNLNRWTLGAIECYYKQGKCSNCEIAHIMETPCNMNITVKGLLAKHGKPTKIMYERLLNIEKHRFETW